MVFQRNEKQNFISSFENPFSVLLASRRRSREKMQFWHEQQQQQQQQLNNNTTTKKRGEEEEEVKGLAFKSKAIMIKPNQT